MESILTFSKNIFTTENIERKNTKRINKLVQQDLFVPSNTQEISYDESYLIDGGGHLKISVSGSVDGFWFGCVKGFLAAFVAGFLTSYGLKISKGWKGKIIGAAIGGVTGAVLGWIIGSNCDDYAKSFQFTVYDGWAPWINYSKDFDLGSSIGSKAASIISGTIGGGLGGGLGGGAAGAFAFGVAYSEGASLGYAY